MNQEIKEICHAIADKKGVLIKVLNVRDLTSIADYFILASTRNKKQSQAAADGGRQDGRKEGSLPPQGRLS